MSLSDYQLGPERDRRDGVVVHRAVHLPTGRHVLLELFSEPHSPQHGASLRQRLEAVAALRHPVLAPVLEVGESGRGPFCALGQTAPPLLPDGAARQGVAAAAAEPRRAASLVVKLAEGVCYTHDHGVFRCLTGPDAVLALGGDEVGLLLAAEEVEVRFLCPPLMPPENGALMGRPAWIAPEIALQDREKYGPPVDIWGLGVLLFQLLTGRAPFQRDSIMETLMAAMMEPTPELAPACPDAGPELAFIVGRCLQKNPDDRYPDAAALATDLHRYLAGETVAPPRQSFLGRWWQRRRRR